MSWQTFDKKYGFSGQLGAIYSPKETTFCVWAPKEAGLVSVSLRSYDTKVQPDEQLVELFAMELGEASDDHAKNKSAVWEKTLKGDQLGLVYSYEVRYENGKVVETQDPYSRATIVNGTRSVVAKIDEAELGEADWRLEVPTAAIIEEIHVRDFSISETSGVSEKNRGKFLGLTESETKNFWGDLTGFDYLKSLGVNTVQLMPIFDFETVDETKSSDYNWGYDPQNYNVPEGSYATDPFDPMCRINELKETIQKFHESGFNVVMDVVYNHVYDRENSSFEKLAPGYYFRYSDATGCGNDTASEREMFSKFIVDSVIFWAKNYGFDGFRFDLMGCLDVETMNKLRSELDKLDRRILIYGEGWDMPTDLMIFQKANQKNLGKMPRIGAFNDALRNTIKGNEFEKVEYGFVDGLELRKEATKELGFERKLFDVLKGSKKIFAGLKTAEQMINYVEAHDNLNLNDQMLKNHPEDSAEMHSRRIELACALNLLAFGVPFMEIGQEFERTKLVKHDWKAAENSYRSGDFVNAIDWTLVTEHASTIEFIKSLIAFRRENLFFQLNDFEKINRTMSVRNIGRMLPGMLIYTLSDGDKHFKVIINASGKDLELQTYHARVLLTNSRGNISKGDRIHFDFELSDMSITILSTPNHTSLRWLGQYNDTKLGINS